MKKPKKGIEKSHWKVGDADGFQAVDPVDPDEKPEVAESFDIDVTDSARTPEELADYLEISLKEGKSDAEFIPKSLNDITRAKHTLRMLRDDEMTFVLNKNTEELVVENISLEKLKSILHRLESLEIELQKRNKGR
jgi:DNA-binding phage protein